MHSDMPQKPAERPLITRLQVKLAGARFLSFSVLVHITLVILGGSIVIYRAENPTPDFTPGDGPLVSNDQAVPAPPNPDTKQLTDQPPTLNPTIPPPSSISVESITTMGVSSNPFQTASIPVQNPSSMMSNIENGMAERMAKAGTGSGVRGGTTRMLGQREKISNAFVGTFYDLKQTRGHKPTGVTPEEYHKIFRKYAAENWKESVFNDYFRAKDPVYATQIFTPDIPAEDGPKAFGLEKEVQPSRWLVHYRARVSPPESGTYHFVGAGDDVMMVRFDGKLVLDRCWYQQDQILPPEQNYDYGWSAIPHGFGKGSAVRLRGGQYYDMDVLIGEQPGGRSYAALLVEQEGVEYQKDSKGNPILPVFRLADGPLPDPEPGQTYAPHMVDGPVWKAMSPDSGNSTFDQFFGSKN